MLYYNKSLTRNSMSTYAVFYTSIEQLSWTNQFLGPLLLQFNVLSCILIVEFKLGRYLERTFKLLFKTIKVNGFKVKFERKAAGNQSASLIWLSWIYCSLSYHFPIDLSIDIDKQKKKFPPCMIVKNLREERFIQINLFFLLFRENFLLRKGVIVMHLIF